MTAQQAECRRIGQHYLQRAGVLSIIAGELLQHPELKLQGADLRAAAMLMRKEALSYQHRSITMVQLARTRLGIMACTIALEGHGEVADRIRQSILHALDTLDRHTQQRAA